MPYRKANEPYERGQVSYSVRPARRVLPVDSMLKLPTWLVIGLTAAAALVCLPLTPWIALALWLALFARKYHERITLRLHGHRGLAATITVSMLLLVALPVGLVVGSLVIDSVALVRRLMESEQTQALLVKLVQNDVGQTPKPTVEEAPGAVDLLVSQGDRAWSIARQVAGAAAHFVIGLLVMVTGMYGVLVNGAGWYRWLDEHGPLSREHLRRFGNAFLETGRGLWFGIFGAGLIQSVVATIAYLVIGVPSALPLGMLTLLFSVIPAIGTAIVWLPIAFGLALTGQTVAAVAMVIIGVAVIGTVDNLARPYLARKGQLQLPTWVVLIAMFGGVEMMGGWGLLMGPLIVRLAKEALMIWRLDSSGIVVATTGEPVESRDGP
jgi:predicted PurR-regulated permease PerM